MTSALHLKNQPKKILIIRPSALGDIVHSLPFLYAIKNRFPEAEIHWIVARELYPFLEGHPMIHKLWIFDKNRWKKINLFYKTIREIIVFCLELRSEKFDITIDLSGLLRSGLIAMVSGAPVKIGFEEAVEGSSFFYTHKIKGGMQIHAIDRYLKIASFLGCKTNCIKYPFAPLPESPEICKLLPKKYIVLSPSAGKEANRWSASRFGELAAKLPLPVVITGSRADVPIARVVEQNARKNSIFLAGKTGLKELAAVIKNAMYLISNDSGPTHIAAAFNVPVFAIFGPANHVRTGPYGSIHTVIQNRLPCSPCYRKKPCDHFKCMNDLSVEKVYNIIMQNQKLKTL